MPLNPLEEAVASQEDELLEAYLTETDTDDVREHVKEIVAKARAAGVTEGRTAELNYQIERMQHDRGFMTPQPRPPKPKSSGNEGRPSSGS